MEKSKIQRHLKDVKSFLDLIKKDATDCVGGKRVTILRKDWLKFEKIMSDLNDADNVTS